ncbi:hypothetical protein G7Y89_g11718 [Cudoniella acicularis]|uniref:Uncharacterized protein n=1 Tax=Cudoniella acicularis TaxID=354080 RepID=A0A8H4RAE9_9HELO|nr:hypothetical protein G7Y89_g11718 [Cudoniella acicularis]
MQPILYLSLAATVCFASPSHFDFSDTLRLEGGLPDWINLIPANKAPQSIQQMMAKNPNGLNPDFKYSINDEKIPEMNLNLQSTISSIDFYATAGCHGGGANGDINIVAKDFAGAKLCPTGNSGDGNNDDLEDNGASFFMHDNLGNCQLHWYKAPGCNDGDWLGFTGGSEQGGKCNIPYGGNGKAITGIRAFNYICEDD